MGERGQWIPWQETEEWSQVVVSITIAVGGLAGEVEHLRKIARQIDAWYADLDSFLDGLGAITCCNCTTICCTMATVWYDLKDLLVLYLADNQLPKQQITRNADRICVHLTPHGCCLNRRERPFLCTWYICPAQKEALNSQKNGSGKEIFALIAQLKMARKELEIRFVDAIR